MAGKCMRHVIMILGWTHTQDVVSTCCILANWVSWMLEIRAVLVGFMGQPRRSQKKKMMCEISQKSPALYHKHSCFVFVCLFFTDQESHSFRHEQYFGWSPGDSLSVTAVKLGACCGLSQKSDSLEYDKVTKGTSLLSQPYYFNRANHFWWKLTAHPQFLCECWAELHFQ